MTTWLVIAGVGLGTYAFRAVMFAVVATHGLPAWTDRPLAFVGPAALGALVGSMLLTRHGRAEIPGLAEVVAAACAYLTVHRTGNVAHGIVVAFPVLWSLAWLTG
jgi:branched-subunit amino acid transport protein